jgi:putative transposase
MANLTEQHIVKTKEWEHWCIKAKNLYNQSLYYWRQSIFKNIEYFTEYELIGLYREYKEENFIQLPSHCGHEVLKNLFYNIKSWQKARKEYEKNPSKFLSRPRLPKYKKELSILGFNNGQIKWKEGYIHFPKMIGIAPIGSKLGACRVIPKSNHFVVEFVYEVKEKEQKEYNGNAIGIDLGLNNLATIVSNTGESFIINGKPLKSINRYYNKRKSNLQSKLSNNKYISKKIQNLTLKRNNKIKNYIHHASKFIVSKAEEMNISKIVIGNNKNWKQEISIGKKNNQNFVSIPHSNLIDKIEYKAKMVGIEVVRTEESYTSKCSALDYEPIKKHEIYLGKRIKRGLFRSSNGTKINADSNGSLNILRKVVGDAAYTVDSILSCVIQPRKINVFEQKLCKI